MSVSVASGHGEQPVKAAVYARISRDRAGDELGVRRQERDARELASSQGWVVAEVFVDDDVSAFSGGVRSGYEAMLTAVRSGRVNGVVAWHPDRLHRSPKELERFIDLVDSTGCRVITCRAGEVDLSTATGRMTARVVGAVARHESEQKGERLKAKHDELARRGRWSGGSSIYGHRSIGDGQLEVVPEQAEVIREVAERVLRGESLYSIASDLNVRKIPTARGATWRVPTLNGLLRSGRMAALRTSKGEVVGKAAWEPIVDRKTWERLQRVLGKPGQRGRRPKVALLAGGIARCGRCGEPLFTLTKGGGRRTYVCKAQPQGRGCGRLSITAEPLEQFVTEAVHIALDGADLRQFRKPTNDAVAQQVANDETMLAELAQDLALKRITRAEWLAARDIVEARLREGRSRLGGGGVNPFENIRDVRSAWPGLDLDQRRAIVAAVVDRVSVAPSERRGPTFDTDRITVTFRG